MPKNTEHLNIRVPESLKSSINRIPTDNSKWVRDVLQREIDMRELRRDEKKKDSPAKIERVKEITSELDSLESELDKNRARLEEVRDTVNGLEEEIAKKKSLKQNIISEIEEETEMDELMIKQISGDLQ